MPPVDDEVDEYFIETIKNHVGSVPCSSIRLRDQLRKEAVTKNGNKYNRSDNNLLFPPSTITAFLKQSGIVQSVLGCNCAVCRDPPGGRDVLTDGPLSDILVSKVGPDADETRRKFCVLLFMGAGFSARHVCSFDNRGWRISSQAAILSAELFEPLHQRRLFNDLATPDELTEKFMMIFDKSQQVFRTPTLKLGDFNKLFVEVNLPFLYEKSLLPPNRRGNAQVYRFEIHQEFQESLPRALVRKELPWTEGETRERDALQLIADSKEAHLIRMLCWYRLGKQINYVFESYPGTLEGVLKGQIIEPQNARQPARYHGSCLQHWLWQGMVDIISAMAFFHTPKTHHVKVGDLAGAHCDIKPANVLVDNAGNLIVTDFGNSQLIRPNQRGSSRVPDVGDYNYQPPIPSSNRKPSMDIQSVEWLQGCDVWSMGCILIEVIEYIKSRNGPAQVTEFRNTRCKESGGLNWAFWIAIPGGYKLRKSVRLTLDSFRSTSDQYLNSVTDLIEQMLHMDYSMRPSMAQCFAIISQNVPTDEWPLLDSGEVSISGLGASTLLRNMPTQFERKMDSGWDRRRCKMYLLLNTAGKFKRVRFALEFLKKSDGPDNTYVLSDSARLVEEMYKPISFFDRNYAPKPNQESLCAFNIIHPNLRFVFEQPFDYFHFLTATTRQEICIYDDGKRYEYADMRTAQCRIRPPGVSIKDPTIWYGQGHVQIWKELSDDEFIKYFIPTLKGLPSIDRRGSLLNSPIPGPVLQATTSNSTSSSSGSSANNDSASRITAKSSKYRLVLFMPGPPPRYLTISLTSGLISSQWGRSSEKSSPRCLTIRSIHKRKFLIGNFSADDFPGVPLEPRVFEREENFEANWVEIEFQTQKGLDDCNALCAQVLKERTS